jgi:hypothetical protein
MVTASTEEKVTGRENSTPRFSQFDKPQITIHYPQTTIHFTRRSQEMNAKKPKLFVFALAMFAILLAACQPITAEPMMAEPESMFPLAKVRFGLPGG